MERPFLGIAWPVRIPSGRIIVERSEYQRQRYLGLACTQLPPPYKPSDQERIMQEWCRFFRESPPVRELALRSRVPPELFEAVCDHRQLTRLHVKWGPVRDLTPLRQLKKLEGLSLGTTRVGDISAIAELPKLTLLQLDNLKRVHDFGALSNAERLEFLRIEGYPQGPQKIHINNLEFARRLHRLRALSVGFVIVDDFDISPLFNLRKLEYLDLPSITNRHRDPLLEALPKLRFGNVVERYGG
jgi:Leucine-rich repeat (LRR) protein